MLRTNGIVAFTVALLALTLPTPAVAQLQLTDPVSTKSEATAVGLSLAGTVLPILSRNPWAVLGGIVLGPNAGDVYIGGIRRAATQSAIRAGVAGATIGLAAAICSSNCYSVFGNDDDNVGAAMVVGVFGAAVTAALIYREIKNLPERVRERNDRELARAAERNRALRIQMGPMVDPRDRSLGVRLDLRF